MAGVFEESTCRNPQSNQNPNQTKRVQGCNFGML